MNTYQISLKTSIILMCLNNPYPGNQGHESTTQWFTKKLNKRGLSSGGILASRIHTILRAVLMGTESCTKILIFSTRFSFENLAVENFVTLFMGKKSC